MHVQSSQVPKPQPRSKMTPPDNLPELPSVPSDIIAGGATRHDTSDEIDFDDLARRFEELKKRQWWHLSTFTLLTSPLLRISYQKWLWTMLFSPVILFMYYNNVTLFYLYIMALYIHKCLWLFTLKVWIKFRTSSLFQRSKKI